MSEIPMISMEQVGVSIGTDGRSMRLEIEGEGGNAVHLLMDATNAPQLCANVLLSARDCLAQLPPDEQLKLVAADLQQNLLNAIPATTAKAVMASDSGQLMLHLGTIVLRFELPAEALTDLAKEILDK